MLDRRNFLSTGFSAALALRSNSLLTQLQNAPTALPDHSLLDKNEDAYWSELRKQFLIPEDEVYLNNGTVGSSPAPVLRAIFDAYTATEKLDQREPEDYPIWGYASWNEFRAPLAEFVGCHRDEIALLRNATEANSYIANGLDMKPGDEVLMTDQEHPGGEHPWDLKAKRYGVVVKKVTLPRPVKDAAQVLNLVTDDKGAFRAAGLVPGTYSVKVSAPAFLPTLREKISLKAGARFCGECGTPISPSVFG